MSKKPLFPVTISVFLLTGFYFIISSCGKDSTQQTSRPVNPVTVTSNIKFGSNKDWQGQNVNLMLDIYRPTSALSSSQKFPLIVYAHGGGFHDGSRTDNKTLMNDFASAGFVSVSIDYRLGWTQSDNCVGDTTESKEAVYRAVQDARAAIRFLVANADKYNIDVNHIFLDGESAGAITILNTQYLSQEAANIIIPGSEDKLGPLATADNNLTNAYTITGIGSVAGCLYSPDLITQQNAVPTIYMQGQLDSVVPYNVGPSYFCPNFVVTYGSLPLYNRTSQFVPTVLHVDPTGEHTVYDEPFIKDNEVCFFNSIMSKQPQTGSFTGTTPSCE